MPDDAIDTALAIGSMTDWITPLLAAISAGFGFSDIAVPTVPGIAPVQIVWHLQQNGVRVMAPMLDFSGEWLCMAVDDPDRAHVLTEWCW